MVPVDDGASPAPIDRSVLERIQSRFVGNQFTNSAVIIEEGNLYLRIEFSDDYYPGEVAARLEIRWYRKDDFTIHYQEEREEGVWKCRWDRHPNAHNARDHFHPPSDAGHINGEDAQWPPDHRDVCRLVLDSVEEHIQTLWESD